MSLESKLYNALQSGNQNKIESTFELIYSQYFNLLSYVCFQYSLDEEDVKDLVQETFIDFFNHLNLNDRIKNIKYYLIEMVKNKSRNFLNKKNRLSLLTDEEIGSLPDIHPTNQSLKLYGWQKGLEADEIDIITKHILLELSLTSIAKEENVSKNTIKSRYRRALAKVKKNLGGDD